MKSVEPYLVCNRDTTIDINEAVRVSIVDLVDDMVLLSPFWIDLAETFLVFNIALNEFSRESRSAFFETSYLHELHLSRLWSCLGH